ncbi:flagellar hook-associated protein 3 FlgL [Oikeobacillus pervagus]|uniref:Flagellar hook-associated protein 3 FlgL n=1 Tax=Oikeobacillus pervagus TaxID=1325931 RepID=A0AAJ1T520_9BACI|nr:flagellar hook-associated protein FlgL [Oikeobacillus pervagus]MDQ0214955.1 flagellar hook-associated protein 3 FlgL [Oikeobacillus pervagus]
MRVTQSMLSNNMLRNLSNSYERLGKYQEQMNTQKKITRPSDDPVIAMKGITYRRNLMEVEQYKRNFGEAHNWIENSDAALDKATKALHRIRELTVQASNDTYEESQRKSISAEVKQLRDHLVEIANTKFGDKYLFNGSNTLNKPVDLDAKPVVVPKDSNPVNLELSKGIYMQVNVDPSSIFTYKNDNGIESGLFGDINELIKKLEDPNASGEEINGFLEKIDNHLDNVTNARADLGARSNRIDLMEERVEQLEVISKQVMSENEDIEFEKVATELITQESVHRAALSVGARIIQPTLMDFLR